MGKKDLKVAVVGAGLNGLALALSLRMFGIEATVYEQADKPRADGTGIIMWPEGMQILAALTDAEKIKQAGNSVDIVTTLTATSDMINQLSIQAADATVNAPIGLFHRRELYQLLLDAYGEDNIQTGQHCNVDNSVIMMNGEPLIADVIVGADGLFSQVRQFVAPEVNIRQPGVYCCRGTVDFDTPEISDDECYVFAGMQSRIVTYTYDRDNHSKYWFAACPVAEGETLDKNSILDKFAHYSPFLLKMIKNTPESQILPSPLADVAPFSQWSRDNAVLLGDSCCAVLPTMGIGFSLGIENAYILAQSLAANFNHIPNALQRYQQRAQQRSHDLQNITHRLSQLTYTEAFNPTEVQALYQQFITVNSCSAF
ncbi:2-polyprenyl-6-methoxyphenol hydroxylase-like oxidoreductase [Shewanella psychrophila]|uniref:2-polyprenyl-6-methoxyphenol hydroxylase-like oxidoreductase n=1 Tax=Shewanella psychrophila TaxID=225848 RepID=A0A1S6HVW4_9GAMM|nr:FAD-dependent monooxygenase [Shewanella psychrophila]AQS39574.1 2-polyprenyl-6-methoxyphenol hydroxylase-like oxidoreductase [Shewanella psychrophila]